MKGLLLWMLLAQVGDISTTLLALHRGCKELNPLIAPHPRIVLSIKGGTAVYFTFTFGRHPARRRA